MWKHYALATWRNLIRNKVVSATGMTGLALGMASCLLVLVWIDYELSFDRFHDGLNSIYLVGTRHVHGDEVQIAPGSPPAVGPALQREYAEVEGATRLHPGMGLVVASQNARNREHWYAFVRIQNGEVDRALGHLRRVHQRLRPESVFDYWFVEDELSGMYRHVEVRGQVLGVLAGLGVFVSAFGLFAMTVHLTDLRRREIGVRKVLGASTARVTLVLTRDATGWVLAAVLISVPVAYLLATRWLGDFPHRWPLGPSPFVAAALLVIGAAAATVGGTAFRAAVAKPAETLRCE